MSSSAEEKSAVVPVLDSIEPPAASEVSVLDSIEPPGASDGAVREVSVLDSLEPPAPLCSEPSEVSATRGKRVRASPDPVPSTSGGAFSSTSAVRELVQLRAGPAEGDYRPSKRTHLYASEILSFWNMERIFSKYERC
ncbi:hypothetical protein O0L34_g9334 [Tuta absoluta]|nr:hypothetical protein O0L34_g9334 [Tuta absoluta]